MKHRDPEPGYPEPSSVIAVDSLKRPVGIRIQAFGISLSLMTGPEQSTSRTAASGPTSMAAEEMKDLVLEYLNHHCYNATADILASSMAREGPEVLLDADGDEIMSVVEDKLCSRGSSEEASVVSSEVRRARLLRTAIREQILSGDVTQAREALIEHFPSVLALTPTSHSPQPSDSPNIADTSNARHEALSNSRTNPSPISLEPQHIDLNLHIQEFIESVRTVPLSRSLSPSLGSPSSSMRDLPAPDHLKLLKRAQQLSIMANDLPSASDRDIYHKELDSVCALLAYLVPEKSLVSRYMSMQRREAVAEQVNRAILFHAHQNPISDLQQYAEHVTVLYNILNELGVLCNSSSLPMGVQAAPDPETTSLPVNSISAKSSLPLMVILPFDLTAFASTHP